MMNYDEFKSEVEKRLVDFYGDDATVEIKPVIKNNGKVLDGINIFYHEENNVVPIIYLNDFFARYEDGALSLEAVVNDIVNMRSFHADPEFDFDSVLRLKDWDNVSDKVFPILVSTEANKDILDDYVHKDFLDLSILYVIRVITKGESNVGNIKIKRDMFEYYGISEDQLYDQAVKNLSKEGYQIRDVMNVIADILESGDELDSDYVKNKEFETGRMYVFSNKCGLYGAAGILNPEFLDAVGRSFYIIPSSVHETIWVPEDEDYDQSALDEMVQAVNESELSTEDVLSSHSYYFDYEKKEIRIKKCA